MDEGWGLLHLLGTAKALPRLVGCGGPFVYNATNFWLHVFCLEVLIVYCNELLLFKGGALPFYVGNLAKQQW